MSPVRAPILYLVDDDDAVRDSLKLLLEAHGLAVADFGGARDFLQRYDGDPDGCLILDLHLPILGGLDLIRILRRQNIALPVIVITGRADREVKARALEAGAAAFLDKPVEEKVLFEAIRAALQGRGEVASACPATPNAADPGRPASPS